MKVRAMVLTAPGVNCDRETLEACRLAGADVEPVHLNELLAGRRSITNFGFLLLPGGFSYGDHLGAGAMLATVLRHRFLDAIHRFVASGRPVLGICNGFQVLARLGLLGEVALAPNLSGRFECRWVGLQVEPSPCLFLRGLERLELPIAHGEGRVVALPERLSDLLPLAPLRYCANPNGSISAIAGVCNTAGNVFGLMPHPERYVSPYQHPDWHRLRRLEEPRVTGEDSRAKPNGSDPASYGRIAYAPRMAYAPHPAQGTPALESRECEPTGLALFRNAVRYVQEEL